MAEIKRKVVLTDEMIDSLESCLEFLQKVLEVSIETVISTHERILEASNSLAYQPFKGQIEPYLEHLNKEHRRIIEGHYKIVYLVEGDYVYIVRIFDSRMHPDRMRG
jgi:plasmid stabilization system protein ParE